jgi:ubiquinol-cytochrome c reductase cytochrome b subunit
MRGILQWIEDRTGLVSGIRHFLNEDIPASAGWHQVFGSVALFAFLMQVFSGLLLAVNYAPTPGEAWESLRYIVTQVTAGSVIRAMHHWGASAMIIVVGIHMVQAFLWGAYKKPREATWIVGVVLLLLTLAFGLTGYLLVWDNRAYWGTVVTTHITGLAPGGSLLLRILGTDGDSIGRVTFARFYASHVTLLPLVTALLIGFHVFLVRKHGITPVPGDEHKPKKKFFPEQVFKDTVGMFVWFAAVAMMVALVKVPLGPVADPTDTSFIPRPEWYFLFLFQALKLFQGPLEVFGAVVLPGIAMGLLTLAPFLDRGKLVRITRRTGAIALTVLAVIGWTGLTARAVATTPKLVEEDGTVEIQAWQKVPPSQLAGIGAFRKGNCSGCHMLGRSGAGPDLAKAVSTKSEGWLMDHFRKPAEDSPNPELSDTQLRALVQLVTKRTDDVLDAWKTTPEAVIQGAVVYQANACGGCHTLNGEGGNTGPVLNGVHLRHDRSWVKDHFADPAKLSPGSEMPPFDSLTPQDLDSLTDYVMSIPK